MRTGETPVIRPSHQMLDLDLQSLDDRLNQTMLRDRHTLRRRLRGIQRSHDQGRDVSHALTQVAADIDRSLRRRQQRQRDLPKPTYPDPLPVVERREEIKQAIANNQVIVLTGETGSGKTTQLPKICLELCRGVAGLIGHTQPRRIAARSVAKRIAQELDSPLGHAVGYKVRFSDQLSDQTCIKLMTDGILLAETQSDPYLEHYDTIIIDEAHERSLNIDFLLGYLKQLLPKRPELKLIITSATIDPQRFSKHFNNAPMLTVSGRTYPVELRYRPLQSEDPEEEDMQMEDAILAAVDELSREGSGFRVQGSGTEKGTGAFSSPPQSAIGNPQSAIPPASEQVQRSSFTVQRPEAHDILIFLTGEREIRETAESLRKHHPPETQILPLYARLSADEQNKIFKPHNRRRIVLATNVAETSLTVPGIRYVVDPGYARISRYNARNKVQRLPIESISQASADQRKGRCGRVAPGVCIRLYSEEDFNTRDPFTPPEILRTNLASVILQMKALRLGEIQDFPFIDPPDYRQIRDGYQTLHELGAIDEDNQLTPLGAQLARLPIDPRIARMILAARDENCLEEVLIIASALSVQDPRERPLDMQQAADEAHSKWRDENSDFLAYLHLWTWYEEKRAHLSTNQLRKACRQNFLSFVRMREWREIHHQLKELVGELPAIRRR
jgi:ATP-dependent RNA helicase HrpA